MSKAKISIVCCYNNQKIYDGFVKSLEGQTCEYKLIGLNNIGNKNFTSCAAAYNSVIKNLDTEFVIFSHQDILLNEPNTLEKFLGFLESLQPDDILGAAGVKFDSPRSYTNIKTIDEHTGELKYVLANRLEANIMECDTLDECFFGGRAEHFKKNFFDEQVCNHWHLYAVEACLNAKKGGGRVYVCDVSMTHLSGGTVSYVFYRDFYKLCLKYHKDFPFIRTTCGATKTAPFNAFSFLIRTHVWLLLEKFHLYNFLRKILFYDKIKKFLKR